MLISLLFLIIILIVNIENNLGYLFFNKFRLNNVKNNFSKLKSGNTANANYIELVPPMNQNRLIPPFEPPPPRYSSNEWVSAMSSIPQSVILRRIWFHLALTTGWTVFVCILANLGLIPLVRDTLMWFLMGSVLSLLLVFRTNSAYDRFWESRRQLGNLVQVSRSLARVSAYTSPDWETKERIRLLLTVFPRLLISHLEGDYTMQPEIATVIGITGADRRMLLASRNRPFRCVQLLGNIFNKDISDPEDMVEKQIVANLLEQLVDIVGCCERLVRCPVPLAYSRHTSRFLSFFCCSLPFVLFHLTGWHTIPLQILFAWAMYGVEEIGHVIENPFDSEWSQDLLDITRLHSSIEADVQDAMSYRYLTNEPIEEDEEGNDDKKDDTKDVPFVFIG